MRSDGVGLGPTLVGEDVAVTTLEIVGIPKKFPHFVFWDVEFFFKSMVVLSDYEIVLWLVFMD